MLARRDEWTHALPDEAIAELDAAVSRVASEGISLLDISRNTFEMPVLRDWIVPIRQQLQRGIAFALIRGLPAPLRQACCRRSILHHRRIPRRCGFAERQRPCLRPRA